MQPTKHSPELELFTTRRVAVVEGDRRTAEMLHTFFRLMELECSVVQPDSVAVPTLRRLDADVLILDLDLPDLRALDIAREIRAAFPALPIIFLTAEPRSVPIRAEVVERPGSFEELLRLFEVVLALEL